MYLLHAITTVKQLLTNSKNNVRHRHVRLPGGHTLKAYEQIGATGCLRLFKSHRPEYGDGEQLRDFIYVNDAAAMTLHFLTEKNANGIFNVGGGTTVSWNRLAGAVFNAMNRPIDIEYIDMPESIRNTYQYLTCSETSKIRAAGYS